MSKAIKLGDAEQQVLRTLLGYRALSKAGLAVNSTTNTYTLTLGGTKQTDDIITVTVATEAGSVSDSYTVLVGDANLDAVATALELKIEALTGVASSAAGSVITITPATTTEAITVTATVTKASGTPTTTATVAQTIIGAKGIKTANTVSYIVDGHMGSQTTQTNVALTGTTIPVSSYKWYTVSINTDGTVTATPGENGVNWLPAIPTGEALIGAVKVATNASVTFTPGTDGLSKTGVTDTYYDLSVVPAVGYPA